VLVGGVYFGDVQFIYHPVGCQKKIKDERNVPAKLVLGTQRVRAHESRQSIRKIKQPTNVPSENTIINERMWLIIDVMKKYRIGLQDNDSVQFKVQNWQLLLAVIEDETLLVK